MVGVGGRASSHIAAAEDKRKPIVFGGYRKEAHCFWWLQQGFGIYGCSGRALFRRTCVCVTALTVLGCLVLSCLREFGPGSIQEGSYGSYESPRPFKTNTLPIY